MNALVFKTENSTYKLELCTGGFRITKIAEENHNSHGINLGFTKTAWNIHLKIGEPARSGGFTSSIVTDIIAYDLWVQANSTPTKTKLKLV